MIIKHGKGPRLWHGIIADDVGAASLASSHERTKTTVEAATPVGFTSGQLETQPSKPRESQKETQGSGETPTKRRRTKARPVEVTTVAGASPVVSSGRVSQKEILDGKSPTKRRRTKSPVEVTTVAGASPVVSPGRVSQKEIEGGKSPTKRRRTKSPVERLASQGTVVGASPVSSSESQKEARTGKPPAKRLRTNAPPGKQGKRGNKRCQGKSVQSCLHV